MRSGVRRLAAERAPRAFEDTRLRWSGSGWKAHGERGGKLSRSRGELRLIAAAFVVAGPRWFAEGA